VKKKNFVPFTDAEEKFIKKVVDERSLVETRYPLLFGLTATFGLVSVLYGFEKLIDRVELFVNNPWILLVIGVLLLLATGAAYRKLN
jgi:hypothetical protein